ncbi:legumain [Cherax quadricarinatus]|uniref:legumain n=1 Tax=Cherax quadricarinatus TaxID=27406 RepID=UPI00387E3E19
MRYTLVVSALLAAVVTEVIHDNREFLRNFLNQQQQPNQLLMYQPQQLMYQQWLYQPQPFLKQRMQQPDQPQYKQQQSYQTQPQQRQLYKPQQQQMQSQQPQPQPQPQPQLQPQQMQSQQPKQAQGDKQGNIWAVLVAGSRGWYNYRHQSDVCHAYQILHQHGVPDDHIIVMMYDDIANNKQNPTPGVIINRPEGPNVYDGVPKDYTGRDVTPENFLKVLSGDAKGLRGVGSGKVLKSGPNDRVFINMVNHGAPGIFSFPYDYLTATNLVDSLLKMYQDNRFNKMVVYVESCNSGSLFENLLPEDIEVYAVSAAGPDQSSYACYEDKERSTFLGDVFSVKWMEDTEVENLKEKTLDEQYKRVRHDVVTSTVMNWGKIQLSSEKLASFLGDVDPRSSYMKNYAANINNYLSYSPISTLADPCLSSSMVSDDVPVAIIKSRLKSANNTVEGKHWQEALQSLLQKRIQASLLMVRLVWELTKDSMMAAKIATTEHIHGITRWGCYDDCVKAFHTHCYDLAQNTFVLRLLTPIINLCEHGFTYQQFVDAVKSVCTPSRTNDFTSVI